MDTLATPTLTHLPADEADAAREYALRPQSDATNVNRITATALRFTLNVNHRYMPLPGTQIGPTIEIADVPFRMDRQEGTFRLWHEYLPFQGQGKTLLEAEQDLIRGARNLMPLEWEDDPEMRDFILGTCKEKGSRIRPGSV